MSEPISFLAASGVVAATPTIARRFPPARTVVVQNFSMIEELKVVNPTPQARDLTEYSKALAALG